MDVDVSCGFPPEGKVEANIKDREAETVKICSETYIKPGTADLNIRTLPDDFKTKNFKNGGISDYLVPHADTCSGSFPAQSGVDVYNNIKAKLDMFDIYTKCTKVYVPNKDENGVPQMRKDDIIAIVTEPFPGHFTLSYEDVAQYQEYTDSDGTKTLLAIISSRKENVIEGNYDVTVQLFANDTVRLAYTKRQNLAEAVLRMGTSKKGYIVATQDSVDRTMLKLAYAGRYGDGALDGKSGCYARKWCTNYFTKEAGEACTEDHHCKSGKCYKNNRWCLFRCARRCAA